MNEELQLMDDELQTTNEELRERTTEYSSLNLFVESIPGSLGSAALGGALLLLDQRADESDEEPGRHRNC